MKLAWSVACALVAVDCYEKAVGIQQQTLFSGEALWVWWIAAAIWAVVAVLTILGDWRRA
jgi:hypothetical protein